MAYPTELICGTRHDLYLIGHSWRQKYNQLRIWMELIKPVPLLEEESNETLEDAKMSN